jgi:hypothetical protein
MKGRPAQDEAAPYYWRYIDRVASDDVLHVIEAQKDEAAAFFRGISEERSLHRYQPDKWSLREVLSHVNDAERVFAFRALWFARALAEPLPSYDQDACIAAAGADVVTWARHVGEFRAIREASLVLFANLPEEAWMGRGIASGCSFSVRALAYIVAGHVAHHLAVVRERYS